MAAKKLIDSRLLKTIHLVGDEVVVHFESGENGLIEIKNFGKEVEIGKIYICNYYLQNKTYFFEYIPTVYKSFAIAMERKK